MSTEEKVVLAIRVRGQVRVRPQIRHTLNKLSLVRLYHARVMKLTSSLQGMVTKAKDYITWGEIDEAILTQLLTKRGRLPGNGRLTDEHVKNNSSYKSIKALAKAIIAGEAKITDVEGLKPIFRLTPPKKGFKGKGKSGVGMGGISGYRGEDINNLANRMM